MAVTFKFQSLESDKVYFTLKEETLGSSTIKISPGSNATFELIFTPRYPGAIDRTTHLKCKSGREFTYEVFGEGVNSPFRVRPLVGAKIPLNSSYAPQLRIHNPDSRSMHILELYTTSSKLHFEPLSREKENFHIYPFEEKVLGKLTFMGIEPGKQEVMARVRYRFDGETETKLLIIPVEVEVRDTPGIYVSEPLLDFGIVSPLHKKQSLSLSVLNAKIDKSRDVEIDWIRTVPNNEPSIKVTGRLFSPL